MTTDRSDDARARRAPIRPGPAVLATGWAAALAVLVGLAGCGGGGGDGGAVTPSTPSLGKPVAAPPVRVAPPSAARVPEADLLATLAGAKSPDPAGTEDGRPVDLSHYVRDRAAALRLGKALFWDTQVGSDGSTACASCHFHAGADDRGKNQIFPGLSNLDRVAGTAFNRPARSTTWGSNDTLRLADFPLHVLADALERNSAIVSSTDDGVGSQGVFDATYVRPGQSRFDDCTLHPDGIFHVGPLNTRRVTGRNSPSVINAVLNVRNFWDGRASETFNGFSPFGDRDPDAGIWVTSAADGAPSKVRLVLGNASAASQAVGPPGNDVEMSCGGRSLSLIARRILDSRILTTQNIDPRDSVFGAFDGGARPTYRTLIQAAFQSRLWDGSRPVNLGDTPFSHMEANFPLFFGLAIQMYEATLISDQAPLDAYLQGDTSALSAAEVRGLQIFTGKGKCISCHTGPALTSASVVLSTKQAQRRIEAMVMGDGQTAVYDHGFYNIGVRPTSEDLGLGGTDPWNNPLSFTRRYRASLVRGVADPMLSGICAAEVDGGTGSTPGSCDSALPTDDHFRDAVDGSFKTPGLRNVALTGPYFHNGSRATLEQVVAFYNRGGDRRGSRPSNTSGFGANPSNASPDIEPLGLSAQEIADLVAFLGNALTDPRVAWERAPFDHPSLTIAAGHQGDESRVAGQPAPGQRAVDVLRKLPATGASGRSANEGPLLPFHATLPP